MENTEEANLFHDVDGFFEPREDIIARGGSGNAGQTI
jgi:hypothetical protein